MQEEHLGERRNIEYPLQPDASTHCKVAKAMGLSIFDYANTLTISRRGLNVTQEVQHDNVKHVCSLRGLRVRPALFLVFLSPAKS